MRKRSTCIVIGALTTFSEILSVRHRVILVIASFFCIAAVVVCLFVSLLLLLLLLMSVIGRKHYSWACLLPMGPGFDAYLLSCVC